MVFADSSMEIMVSDNAFGLESDKIISYKTKKQEVKNKIRSEIESIKRTRKQVDIYGRANIWKYFVTLTFDPEKIDSYNYDLVKKITKKWLDKIRHRYTDVRYLLVFEKHKSGRYHIHALFANCNFNLKYSGKKGKNNTLLYNMESLDYDMGYTTVSYIKDSAAAGRYLSKYIGKSLGEVPDQAKRYWATKNLTNKNDITKKRYIMDQKQKEQFINVLKELADRFHDYYIKTIDNTITYFHLSSEIDIDFIIENCQPL